MHSLKKDSNFRSTTTTHNQAILNHKRNKRKSKKRSQSSNSALYLTTCVAAVLFCDIHVVQGFGLPVPRKQARINLGISTTTSLKYRSHPDNIQAAAATNLTGNEAVNKPHHVVSNVFHTWWTSGKSKRAIEQSRKQDEEQVILDNYLESIDRRYKRLHRHDKKSKDPDTVSNVAWDFLMKPDFGPEVEEQRKQKDAIYVLGLAELASTRLLQRHQLPIPESRRRSIMSSELGVIDVSSNTAFEKSELKAISSSVEVQQKVSSRMLMSSAVFCIQLVKNMQTAYMERLSLISEKAKAMVVDSVKVSAKAVTTTLATTANMISANGGGMSKYAIHFMCLFAASLASTALSVIRPLTKA